MAPAVRVLAEAAAGLTPGRPSITLLSNRDGAVVTEGEDWMARVVSQVANPVRWDQCQATMSALGVTALIELLPGGTLTAIAKRTLPGVELLAVKTPDQLDSARALAAAHGGARPGGGPGANELASDPAGTGRPRMRPTSASEGAT
jgi:[acyl-carrier-protein] S-malonyltransferase